MTGAEAFPYPTTTPEAVEAGMRTVHRVHALLRDTYADVDDANLTLDSSWGGYAAATCVADVTAMCALLTKDESVAEDGLSALKTYRDHLERARDDIDGYRRQYDAAAATRDAADAKIPGGLPDEDRDLVKAAHAEEFNRATASLFVAYGYCMQGVSGSAQTAANALGHCVDTLSPPSYRGSPSGGAPDIDVGSYTSAGMSLSLVMTLDASPDADRRRNQFEAWVEQLGYPPSGPQQWMVAAMLDPNTYFGKNKGVQSVIQVGKVTPQPGEGLVRIGWYIPSDDVFNIPHWDLGDNRGMDPSFDPEANRVALYIDYETGMIIARQNPSVSTAGDVKVGSPTIKVQQKADGRIRIFYDAANALSPPGGNETGHTVNGDIVVTPPSGGKGVSVSGNVGDYPSLEIYHENSLGQPDVVLQDPAATDAAYGPLWYLTQHHDVGPQGGSAVDDFYDDPDHRHIGARNPYLKYPDRYPDTTLGNPNDPPVVVTVP